MDKIKNIDLVVKKKIIAIIRADVSKGIEGVVEALCNSGINIIEISFNTPCALQLIEEISKKNENEVLVGAGTVIDSETAVSAISAGSKFIVSPIYKQEIVKTCLRYNIVSVPGVLTPGEALTAHEAGADFVKIFPAGNLGPAYIKAIKAPLPHLQIIPVGGINIDNARAFLESGAAALAIGGSLVSKEDIRIRDYKAIEKKAKMFVDCIRGS